MSASDSEFNDSDYDRFIASLSDDELVSPSTVKNGTASTAATETADDIDDLVASLEQVSLQNARPPPTPPCTPPRHPRLRGDETLYRVHSPKKGTITTPEWSVASDMVQSDPGSHAVAELRRQKSKKSPKVYVVFIGKQPGVYTSWDQCEEQTTGVPSVHQGYSSYSDALKAFECAVERGFVSQRIEEASAAPQVHSRNVDFLLDPESAFDNALNVGITRQRWYNVYQGRSPGIYRTYLECSLNVISVSKAVHDSFFTLESARDAYIEAVIDNRVFVRI